MIVCGRCDGGNWRTSARRFERDGAAAAAEGWCMRMMGMMMVVDWEKS